MLILQVAKLETMDTVQRNRILVQSQGGTLFKKENKNNSKKGQDCRDVVDCLGSAKFPAKVGIRQSLDGRLTEVK